MCSLLFRCNVTLLLLTVGVRMSAVAFDSRQSARRHIHTTKNALYDSKCAMQLHLDNPPRQRQQPRQLQQKHRLVVSPRIGATLTATSTLLTRRMMSDTDDNMSSSSSAFRPETNFGSESVPEAQRPINEYLDVTNQPFFTWARDSDTTGLFVRFLVLYSIVFGTICYPISGATFTQDGYLLHKLVSSNVGAMFVTLLLLLRIYSGYDYIGQRLQSKFIEYEETGWYDGDVEVKTKTELLRDRMLYTSQVQPIVDRLKGFVLIGTGYFVGSIIALNVVLKEYPVFDQYNPDLLDRLSYDDKLADRAAINTNGKPAYCDSRYYRAIANGGLGCN
jgi:Conserved in the green lineage and diatoms 27